jgi:hypothetical protein
VHYDLAWYHFTTVAVPSQFENHFVKLLPQLCLFQIAEEGLNFNRALPFKFNQLQNFKKLHHFFDPLKVIRIQFTNRVGWPLLEVFFNQRVS